jgi:hypothetical protein
MAEVLAAAVAAACKVIVSPAFRLKIWVLVLATTPKTGQGTLGPQ